MSLASSDVAPIAGGGIRPFTLSLVIAVGSENARDDRGRRTSDEFSVEEICRTPPRSVNVCERLDVAKRAFQRVRVQPRLTRARGGECARARRSMRSRAREGSSYFYV